MKIIKHLYSSFLVKRNPPLNLKKGDAQFFGGPSFEYLVEASYLARYKNVIVSYQGVIIKNGILQKKFITCYENDFKAYKLRYLAHVFGRHTAKKIKSEKNYLLIFDNYSGPNGFAHWLSDGLPRLVEMNTELKNYVVIVPDYFKEQSVYIQTLACFNIGETEYILPKNYLKIKNLFVITPIGDSGDFLPENVSKLRQFIWDKFDIANSQGVGERIYISRKKATRRFIENEDAVTQLMEAHGFTTVYMEDHSFEAQVKIMYHTKYLVSIHGAALANIHFMRPGTNVLELKKLNDSANCHFYALADALNINYYYQFCRFTEIAKAANNYNLFVDCDELKINLEAMFKYA